ncbi:hypothetical protein E2C01_021744 [Portunus trituberculatus]|uniref:Uncharacterized protein n=1 Tax=Portunus trituberculatus TaxID=210409 RepID=A0A5B7E6Z8_PORTR|nr:hypothetical protein [Portunus trituberculatus]
MASYLYPVWQQHDYTCHHPGLSLFTSRKFQNFLQGWSVTFVVSFCSQLRQDGGPILAVKFRKFLRQATPVVFSVNSSIGEVNRLGGERKRCAVRLAEDRRHAANKIRGVVGMKLAEDNFPVTTTRHCM